MKYFIVKLVIQAGEYEKSCHKLIQAESEESADEKALLGECHGSIEDGTAEWTKSGIVDLGGEFHYSIFSCKEVKAEDVNVLSNYLHHM
jgi:hypothetical protein